MIDERLIEFLKEGMILHKKEFFDGQAIDLCKQLKTLVCSDDGSDIGLRRQLKNFLMDKYGLLEVEAMNVLNGRYIDDYIVKYRWIKSIDKCRQMLLGYLAEMDLPELTEKQYKALKRLFFSRKKDSALLKLSKCNNQKECMQEYLLKTVKKTKEDPMDAAEDDVR